jgi:NAD-dependent deacetylase
MARPVDHKQIVILSGAGLSAASGVPTFRDADGLWEGHRFEDVATTDAWFRDREMVRRFYDERRVNCVSVLPNAGHEALATLQHTLGRRQVTLVTQNVDGLLQKAGAHDVIEMHGSLWRLRCEAMASHPRTGIYGHQDPETVCTICGSPMRPDIVWFGEVPEHLHRIEKAVSDCAIFLSVGTSGVVFPAAGFVRYAKSVGARCIEVNPDPSGGNFDEVIAQPSEAALPDLVMGWLEGS